MFYSNASVSEVKGRKVKTWKGQIRYKNADGQWRSKYKTFKVDKKRDAQKLLREWWQEEEDKAQKAFCTGKDTIAEKVAAFIEQQHLLGVLALPIYQHELWVCDTYVFPFVGTIKYYEATTDDLQRWVNTLAKTYAPSTVWRAFTSVSKVYDKDLKAGKIPKDPTAGVALPRIPRTEHNSLDSQGQQSLLALSATGRAPYYLYVRFGLYTGMRLGEMCGLKWKDIDLGRDTIKVVRAAKPYWEDGGYGKGKSKVMYGLPKNEKKRVIPIIPQLREVIEEVADQIDPDIEDFVMGGNPRIVSANFSRYCRVHHVNGICGKHISMHSLRHTFATNAIASGMDVLTLSRILGHEKPSTTLNIYADAMPDVIQNSASRLAVYLEEHSEV